MNKQGELLRSRMQQWISKNDHNEQELADGALMVLQCNGNRALYNTIMRRPQRFEAKIAYEMRKHLRYMNDGLNIEDVRQLEDRVLPKVEAELAAGPLKEEPADGDAATKTRGRRADHDQLPEEVRALWEKNAERWKKMKQAHETCSRLTQACDRYEYTSALAELYQAYKRDFQRYDSYDPTNTPPTPTTQNPTPNTQYKAVNAARAYISKYLPRLQELYSSPEPEDLGKASSLRDRIGQRVELLRSLNEQIGDDLKKKLAACDL
jgi:hypothetical protein